MTASGCPVCGYPEFITFDGYGPARVLCPCCGFDPGYDAGDEARTEALRRHWLEKDGGRWWSNCTPPPEGWNREAQLAALRVPKRHRGER